MSEFAWTTDIDGDLVDELNTIIAASDPATQSAVVFAGRAAKGALPPFVCVWPLAPDVGAEGLASESWGRAHGNWQLSPHGATTGQARYLAEQITTHVWPAGWELVEIGDPIPDTTDEPATTFYPITLVYRGS